MSDASYQPAPPPQPGSAGGAYPEASQATLALILGILGFFVTITAPFAWYIGAKEKKAIDTGRRDPANRGQAVAGWILGIIVTILAVLSIIFLIILLIAGVALAGSS